MDIKELIGEATEYDKKLALEEKKPKSCIFRSNGKLIPLETG